ncbi:MAG: guanylate kinase [Gammaproteobacteria bacterium]|nr:guanylate kinase [Gammaproteobacteria bacterium]MCY4226528.1 guanylate kinase [Gammaproteobacteria bacterium]
MPEEVTSPKILILSAPSGGGKTSLARALVKGRSDAEIAVSHTTREARPGEIDGVHYRFVDSGTFGKLIDEDAFIEHASVYGNLYGTSRTAVNSLLESGRHAILDIDWQGARAVRKCYPQAVSVFILPPSIHELEQRLRERNQDSETVIRQRMDKAKEELSHQHEFQTVLVNENFDESVACLNRILGSPDFK